MDKYEYNLKLEEINKLVENENYEDAAKIADTVDWRRVRNARTLCMISEIYEANDRLEESKTILMRAYRRSQIGRVVLYRLTEVAIKMKEFDDAVEYYSEFVNAAPNDNSRYVLKYKIYRGRGSSLADQIAILEEYKEKEYTEKWAYELAKLYYKAGENEKCVESCDDLVLWFRQGKYVIKALELKQKLTPLTPVQQAIYDHKDDHLETKADLVEASVELEKIITEKMPTSEEEAITDNIITETQREIAQAVTQHAAEAEAEAEADREKDENWRYNSGPVGIQTGNNPLSHTQVYGEAMNTAEPQIPIPPQVSLEPQIPIQPQVSLESQVPLQPQVPVESQIPVAQQMSVKAEGPVFNVEDLQKELADNMRELVSGMTRTESEEGIIEPMNDNPFFDEESQDEPVNTQSSIVFEDESVDHMSIDDVMTAMAAETAVAESDKEKEEQLSQKPDLPEEQEASLGLTQPEAAVGQEPAPETTGSQGMAPVAAVVQEPTPETTASQGMTPTEAAGQGQVGQEPVPEELAAASPNTGQPINSSSVPTGKTIN